MNEVIEWTNTNSGFLTLVLFFITLFLGWISGIFKHLRSHPKFVFDLIPVPTFCCTFQTGKRYHEYDASKTGIVLYLSIRNIGSASSEIHKVQVGYHNYTFKYSFLWFWLDPIVSLEDFCQQMGNKLRCYPFLIQSNSGVVQSKTTYLKVGESTNGIIYFEQSESYGGFIPRVKNEKVKIKIRIYDIYNKSYSKTFWIPNVSLDYAKSFNKSFGVSLENL